MPTSSMSEWATSSRKWVLPVSEDRGKRTGPTTQPEGPHRWWGPSGYLEERCRLNRRSATDRGVTALTLHGVRDMPVVVGLRLGQLGAGHRLNPVLVEPTMELGTALLRP